MRTLPWLFGALLLQLFDPAEAGAHAMRTAYLELDQRRPGVYLAVWKTTANDPEVVPQFPADCAAKPVAGATRGEPGARALSSGRAFTLRCGSPLAGRTLSVVGMGPTLNETIVQLRAEGRTQTRVLTPGAPRWTIPAAERALPALALSYGIQGFWHILEGPDHLLFLLALMLLIGRPRRVLLTATAFTVAHSITLALSALQLVAVPSATIEACIALSLVLVARDVGRPRAQRERTGPWLGFCFGLVHGFGFAGALVEIGLPPSGVPLALASFNIGVEIGQIVFLGLTFALFRLAAAVGQARWLQPACTYAVGAMGVFWLLERSIGAFW